MIIGLCSYLEKGGFYRHVRQLKELPKHSQVYISPVKRPDMVFAAGCVCAWGCWLTNISSTGSSALGCPCPCPNSDRCQGNSLWKCTMKRTRNLIQVMNCILIFSLTIFQTYPFCNVDYHMAVYVLIQKHLRTQLRSKKKMQKVRGYCSDQCCLHLFRYIHRGSEFPSVLLLVKIAWQRVCSIISTNKESS